MEKTRKLNKKDFEFVNEDKVLKDKVYEETSYLHDVIVTFKKNKGATIGLFVIIFFILMAIFGPYFNEHTYDSVIIEDACLPPLVNWLKNVPFIGKLFDGYMTMPGSEGLRVDMYEIKGVTSAYWFGTDTLGRDLFTRVWSGTRISLIIAFSAVCIDIFIGMLYGLISGFFGGKVDMIMQRIAEILNGIPTLVLVTLLGLILPSGVVSIIIALMITGWIGMERIARAQVLKIKEREFILASRTLGASNGRIIFKEILPNIFGQIIIMSMFSIPNAIFTEAYLSFVGLGVPAPFASLGSLINDGYKTITVYPYMIAAPVLVLAILMLSFNLFADGLRDAFDPKQKQM